MCSPSRKYAAKHILPIYNEMYVVERLVDSVCRIDYPRELLEIQVLDDSTDETRGDRARAPSSATASTGFDIDYIHRADRTGFKAGALDARPRRSPRASSSLIFDADFVPAPDFLESASCHSSPIAKVGMVQVRWGHLNRDYSLLTQVQSILLDGHFIIEHTGAQPRRPLLQLQRHRGHLAPRRHRRRAAAGSTTR